MTRYTAPVKDMQFLLHDVLAVTEAGIPGYEDLDASFTAAVLDEAGKVASEVLEPLNGPGDTEGCVLENGVVRTPPGFKAAFEAMKEGGWTALDCDPDYGGQGLPYLMGTAVGEGLVDFAKYAKRFAELAPGVPLQVDFLDERQFAETAAAKARTGAEIVDLTYRQAFGADPAGQWQGYDDTQPERAWGLDAALEWYLPGSGLASISAFYRNVDDVLFDTTATIRDDRFDSPGFDRTGYDFTTTLNGSDGTLSGVEFAYLQQWQFLPAPFDGFGFHRRVAWHRKGRAGALERVELQHAEGRQRAHVVGPQQVHQRMGQLRQLVIELLPQAPGEKGEALQQALDIRVAPCLAEERRQRRTALGEALAQLAQGGEFALVVVVERHSAVPCW